MQVRDSRPMTQGFDYSIIRHARDRQDETETGRRLMCVLAAEGTVPEGKHRSGAAGRGKEWWDRSR